MRNQIIMQTMGVEGLAFLPFLTVVFFFILFSNLTEVIPGVQFPANARIAMPVVLAMLTWVIFNVVGIVKQGPAIQGVLGICSEGIDWDAPDGVPVRLVLLIATPHNHRNRHLQVLAALSKMVSNEVLRTRLLIAANANQAWEIIESEETPNYNYFLED